MKLLHAYILLLFSLVVVSCTTKEKKEEIFIAKHTVKLDSGDVEFTLSEINSIMRARNINNCLDELISYSDSILYRKRKVEFNKLLEDKNRDFNILLNYITTLEKDFKNKEHLPAYFKEQLLLLRLNLMTTYYDDIAQQVHNVEELLYDHLEKRINRPDGIDRLVGCITPFNRFIDLGETLKTGTGIFAYNLDSHNWFCKTNIYYYTAKDTLLVKSINDTLGITGSGYQDIEFTPTKKGEYLITSEHLFYTERRYKTLKATSVFTVK